jgi:hypothetical protein
MTEDRCAFENGKLDEIVSTAGAHLERIGSSKWFLSFQHADGSETALWFTSRDLPALLEKRGARAIASAIRAIAKDTGGGE